MPKSNLTARMLSVANETADIKTADLFGAIRAGLFWCRGIKGREKGRIASE